MEEMIQKCPNCGRRTGMSVDDEHANCSCDSSLEAKDEVKRLKDRIDYLEEELKAYHFKEQMRSIEDSIASYQARLEEVVKEKESIVVSIQEIMKRHS